MISVDFYNDIYKKQLMTVQDLLKNGENETAVEYIEKLTKNIATEMSEVNVGHI